MKWEEPCANCNGEGYVHFLHDFLDPQTEDWAKCGACGGRGFIEREDDE